MTESDNTWFTLLTMNTNQIHFNAPYAARTRTLNQDGEEVCSFRPVFFVYRRGAPELTDIFPQARSPIDAGD